MKLALLALLAFGLTRASASGFVWTLEERNRQAVEQQGLIENPTPCVWDADDHEEFRGVGLLAPGEVTTVGACVVGDWMAHLVSFSLVSRSPDLIVTLDYGPHTLTAAPVDEGRSYRYELCFTGPDYDHEDPRLEPIGEGVGIVWEAVGSITNPTSRRVRDTVATFKIVQDVNSPCRDVLIATSPSVWTR